MTTKFYKIQYKESGSTNWKNLDETEYTEKEANAFLKDCPQGCGMDFRKVLLYEAETELYEAR